MLEKSKGSEIESKLIYKEFVALNHNKRLEKRINTDFQYVYEVLNKILQFNFYSGKIKQKISELKDNLMEKENKIKSKLIRKQ